MSHDAAHDIFPAVAGQQISCQLCCVHTGTRIEIRGKSRSTTCSRRRVSIALANTLPDTEGREMPRVLPLSAQSPFCLYARIMLAFFYCCGRQLAEQQTIIKLCSLLCKTHSPYLVTSAGMLSGPAALFSLRQRMAFFDSSKDGWSSSFGMIGSFGRSSRKRGSLSWNLFSRFCRYAALLASYIVSYVEM